MGQRWTLGVVLGVVLAFGFGQAAWADPADLKRLLDEGKQAYLAAKYPEALAKWQQGLELAKKSGNQKAMGIIFGTLGAVYHSLGKHDQALENYQQALAIHRELKDRRGEADNLSTLGAVYLSLGKCAQALENYQLALAINREIKDRRGEAANLTSLGLVYDDLSQYDQALGYYQQALAIAREIKDRRVEAAALINLGVVYDHLGQYDRSLGYYQQALAIHRELKDRRGEAADLTNLGAVYNSFGKYDQALEYFKQALAIKLQIKDRLGEGSALTNLGSLSLKLGKNNEALAYFMRALAIYREFKDPRGEASNLTALGMVNRRLGHYDQALEYYQQALAINREIKDRPGEAEDLNSLGVVYDNLGQYDQALEYSQQALAIHREIKDRPGESGDLTNIGLTNFNLGHYDQALEFCQQALVIKREIKDRGGEGSGLNNLGAVYSRLSKPDQALAYYQQALAIDRELKNRSSEGVVLTNLGVEYGNLGQDDKALAALRQGLQLCMEVSSPAPLWVAQRGLGAVEAKRASYDEAIGHYRQALDTIEGLRSGLDDQESKATFMQNKLFVYDELIELLRSLHEKNPGKGYDRDALEIFERKQGRLFLEEMGQSGARNFAGLPEQVRTQETELEQRLDRLQAALAKERSQPQPDRERLQTLEPELSQARAAFQALRVELQTKHPDYYALKYPQPARLAELQSQVLKPGEVMLVYGVMKAQTCLWVIGKESCGLYTLPMGQKDLDRKIAAFRRTVLKAGDGGGKAAGPQDPAEKAPDNPRHELFSLLFPTPVRSAVPAGSRLYIIPTGPLYSLPFEALETQAPGEPPHYLVEDYAIAYLSSASLLKTLREAQARKQAQPPYPLLAFANPRYGKVSGAQEEDKSVRGLQTRAYREIMGGSFAELPETEDEARAIKDILKAPEPSRPLIVKAAASRSMVLSLNQAAKLPDYRYLVFACHGILPGEVNRVVQPALVLADPEKDGFLTMADVFGLRLNAELVSLSACNTGRGSQVKGEGVIGLTRAFMYAGTPAVSVTLWSVESQSAKELNVGMYRYLSQGQGRAQALREIKLAMLRGEKGDEYRDPFFWAPLVVFGDGR